MSFSISGDGWVFHKLNLDIAEGDFVAVIGANGAGKSTLLKMLAHAMPPTVGEIYYYGKPVEEFKEWQKIGYVAQNPMKMQREFPISVEEVVTLGLLQPGKLWQRIGQQEKHAVEKALLDFQLVSLRQRKIGELSGGQQQRVFLAAGNAIQMPCICKRAFRAAIRGSSTANWRHS